MTSNDRIILIILLVVVNRQRLTVLVKSPEELHSERLMPLALIRQTEILLQSNEVNLFSSVMSQARTLVWQNIQNVHSERQLTVNDADYY